MAKRKGFVSEQKFAAALAVISGVKTPVEAAKAIGCHPKMIVLWKKEVEAHGAAIFERTSETEAKNRHIEKLERLIGRLTLENGFLDRVLGRSGGA